MDRIVAFRPGLSENRTAFEAMSDLYGYLQKQHEYGFTIVTADSDEFESDRFKVESIPQKAWKPLMPRVPVYPRRWTYRRHVDQYIKFADIVITVDPTIYPQGALALRRASHHDTPVWFDASATTNGDLDFLRQVKHPWERRAVERATGIIATVPKVIERFRERRIYNADIAEKFTIIGHPVDVDRFTPSPANDTDGTTRLLTISRLVPEKGISYLIAALAPLLRERDDLVFSVLGNGPMDAYLTQAISRLGIESDVELLGTVPHNDVPEVLQSADIYVTHPVANAHWEEFFGVANLEAMACGLPTIVTDCGGIPYVIRDEDVAVSVEQRDVASLRSAVTGLLEDPTRRESLGKAAREYVKSNYSTAVLGEVYHRMLKGGMHQ